MKRIAPAVLACATLLALDAAAQPCPEKNIQYWQGFPPGGEADQSARHQQLVLKRKCPGIETIVQYKPGASGGLMWSQMNNLPGDGYNIVGVTLPHIVLQPMEGQVQYKTEDITPIYWFRYMPDAIVVPETAIQASDRGFIAFAILDGKATVRPVELGPRTGGGNVEILTGLRAGEIIVYEGSDRITNGTAVTVGGSAPGGSGSPREGSGGGNKGGAGGTNPGDRR